MNMNMNTNEKTWYVMNPIPIEMEDAITHTDENGYECDDPGCICHQERREQLPLNGNRGFSLLKHDPAQEQREAAQDRNMTIQCQDGSWW
jgi:hypothetical protein